MRFLNSRWCQASQVQYQFFRVYKPRINFLFSSSQVKQKAREENSNVINGVGSDAHFFPFSFAPYCPSKLSINVNNRCLWKTLDFVSPKLFILTARCIATYIFKTDWFTPRLVHVNYRVTVEKNLHRWWCDFMTNDQGTKYGQSLVTGVRFPRSLLLGTWEKNLLHFDN